MNGIKLTAPSTLYHVTGITWLVLLLCVCVVTQMIGVPVTLVGVFNSDMLENLEPESEDFSVLSASPKAEGPGLLSLLTVLRPTYHLPVLLASLFRPPST